MISMLYKLLCMFCGGLLIGFNAGRLDDGTHTVFYIIGLAMVNFSICSISRQIRNRKKSNCSESG